MSETDGSEKLDKGDFGCWYAMGAVWLALDGGLDLYNIEREKYLQAAMDQLDLDAREQLERIKAGAKVLVDGATDLASMSFPGVLEVLSQLVEGGYSDTQGEIVAKAVSEEIEYLLGCEVVQIAKGTAERMWKLLLLAHRLDPGWESAAFLKRVSRCYLFGFDPECVVMCRSTLDAHFNAKIPDNVCARELEVEDSPRRNGPSVFRLCDRIAVAKMTDRISPETAEKADQVRGAGNAVVHHWPEVPKAFGDCLNVISTTVAVIRELSDEGT